MSGPYLKKVLIYSNTAVGVFDDLAQELKVLDCPEFQPMIDGIIAARKQIALFVDKINTLDNPDSEPPRRSNNNVIPLRKLPKN